MSDVVTITSKPPSFCGVGLEFHATTSAITVRVIPAFSIGGVIREARLVLYVRGPGPPSLDHLSVRN